MKSLLCYNSSCEINLHPSLEEANLLKREVKSLFYEINVVDFSLWTLAIIETRVLGKTVSYKTTQLPDCR